MHLPKLKPKPRDKLPSQEDYAVELHNKDGRPYWVPAATKDNEINNVRQWEQCFRVYAAIYSRANPLRATEIWQYIEIINQAAATLCGIMWPSMITILGKTWPEIPKEVGQKLLSICGTSDLKEHKANHPQLSQQKGVKNVCWRFNRGNCPYGPKCRFEHRCGYCGGHSHTSQVCRKKGKSTKPEGGTPNRPQGRIKRKRKIRDTTRVRRRNHDK